jgi:hypothetical protein
MNIKSISLKILRKIATNLEKFKMQMFTYKELLTSFRKGLRNGNWEATPIRAGVSQGCAMVYEGSRSDIKRNARG